MSLSDEVERLRHRLAGTIEPADDRLLDQAGRLLDALEDAANALAVGDTLPEFALRDTAGRLVHSADLLARGPLVLSLFRHGWLAACGSFLVRMEAARPAIEALGGTLAGVAPQDVHHLVGTTAGRGFRFLLLGDPEQRLARLCGLACDPPSGLRQGRRRPSSGCAAGGWCRRPIAATFVVGQDGVVGHASLDPPDACVLEPGALVLAARAARADG